MHNNNNLCLLDWRVKYPECFKNCKVLELGSRYINGTVRGHFKNCEYVGIDRHKGECVDIAVEAKNTQFVPEYFDVIISFSMFEHDPDWRESLSHNMQWLKNGGVLFISYGAEGNPTHFHGSKERHHLIIPHQDFLTHLKQLNIKILEKFWECDKYITKPRRNYSPGTYYIVGMKQ